MDTLFRSAVLVAVWGLVALVAPAQPSDSPIVRGRVLDAETNEPLPHTHVFVAQSMNGTVTDSTGRFRLDAVHPGAKRLYLSRVGYANRAVPLRPTLGRTQVFTLRLEPEVLETPSVTVSAERDEDWYERLDRFKRLFIGPSGYADDCTLVNPEVLRFEKKWWGKFEVQAEKPLIIENRALGYRLKYFLKEFEERGSVVRWDGEPLFEPLSPEDSLEAARWRQNRREVYRGSLRHFLEALLHDRLEEEQFDLYRLPRASAFRHTSRADRFPTSRNRILEPSPDSTHHLSVNGRLEVIYRGAPESEAYLEWAELSRRRAPREYQTSQIKLNQSAVHVDSHGEIVEPYGATLYQYFAFTTRLATLLPREYDPPNAPALSPEPR
ncbi:MAG: carboxypeptidase regulatory-like domain-containing protein [Bacteroidetes bacterium QH_9_64_21]|nr:MAG: carboxypeptidase regulatory-like domain-containing protein [Bacteroidetes bacterium QH_9_64_21]